LLLFVYWLGTDVGVFALALALKNRSYSYEQRTLLMRLSLTIDMVPRMAMITVAPVGLQLASRSGLIVVPQAVSAVIWVLAIIWIVGEWFAFKRMGQPTAIRFYLCNGVVMLVACLALTGFGIMSLMNGRPFAPTWLALKVLLSGLVFFVSIMMAVFYAPLEGVFKRMATEGSSDEIEAEVCSYVNKGAFFTVALFFLLATIGFLGLVKPV